MSCPGQASEHDADHGQPDEGSDSAGVALEIARQAAIAADPGQSSLDDPALGQDDEFVQFVALDDLDHPKAGAGSGSRDAWSLKPESAKMRSMKGKRQRVRRSRTNRAPSSAT